MIVDWRSEAASQAGVERGDRLLRVDGEAVNSWYRRRGWEDLRAGVPIRYELQRSDLTVYTVSLMPESADNGYGKLFVPLYAASMVVGIAYLALGLVVWGLRGARPNPGPSCSSAPPWPCSCGPACTPTTHPGATNA